MDCCCVSFGPSWTVALQCANLFEQIKHHPHKTYFRELRATTVQIPDHRFAIVLAGTSSFQCEFTTRIRPSGVWRTMCNIARARKV